MPAKHTETKEMNNCYDGLAVKEKSGLGLPHIRMAVVPSTQMFPGLVESGQPIVNVINSLQYAFFTLSSIARLLGQPGWSCHSLLNRRLDHG